MAKKLFISVISKTEPDSSIQAASKKNTRYSYGNVDIQESGRNQAMKRSIELSVPSPCHEKWSEFIPTSRGGYCGSCKKEVVDFTGWSEEKIETYFSSGAFSTCGRFKKDQLKKYQLTRPTEDKFRFLPASLLGFTLLLNPNEGSASHKTLSATSLSPNEGLPDLNEYSPADTLKPKTIEGVIRSAKDQAEMPGVNVILKGTTIGTASDVDGKFSITIDDAKATDTLVFSFIGCETIEKGILQMDGSPILLKLDETQLSYSIVVAGMVCVRPSFPRSVWWKIKNIFR